MKRLCLALLFFPSLALAQTIGGAGNYGVMEVCSPAGCIFSGPVSLGDDVQLQFGDGLDYWCFYNSTATEYQCVSTDVDGGGTDGVLWSVADGTDDVDFTGEVTAASFSSATANPAASGVLRLANTEGIYARNAANSADESITLDGSDVWRISDTTAIPSGEAYSWDSLSKISTATDGNVILTNNSGAGFNLLQLGGTTNSYAAIKADGNSLKARLANDSNYASFEASTLGAYTSIFAAGSRPIYWVDRARMYSPADGQFLITNRAVSAGVVLDVDDTANTIVVKDQAGTGAGYLSATAYSSATANPASTGALRVANTEGLYARNAANDGDESIVLDGSDIWQSSTDVAVPATNKIYLDGGGDTYIYEDSADTISFMAGGATAARISSTDLTLLGLHTSSELYFYRADTTFNNGDIINRIIYTGRSEPSNASENYATVLVAAEEVSDDDEDGSYTLTIVDDGADVDYFKCDASDDKEGCYFGKPAVLNTQVSATPTAPTTCDATALGMTQVVNDSDDGAGTQICYCGMTDDSTYDWLDMSDNTACDHY